MKVLMVSNMYPDDTHPSYGIFVKKFADELGKIGVQYSKSVMYQKDGKVRKASGYIKFYIETFLKSLFGKYDVVYIHYASHSSAAVLAANHFRKMTIYTNVHGSDVVPENAKQESMQKYTKSVLKKSDKIIVPSEYFEKYVKNKYGLGDKKYFVYPSGGIDPKVFFPIDKETKEKRRKEFGFSEYVPVFGMAGRISVGKGWDTFVKAIEKIPEGQAQFIIVGSGTEDKALDELIERTGTKDRIKRIGLLPQDKLADFYRAIDYLVFPSKREGESLGLVPLEAMACGTPVIASDFAAPKYYIMDGKNGYKFLADNENELAGQIECCCGITKESYFKLSEEAYNTSKPYFSDNVRIKLRQVFKQNC